MAITPRTPTNFNNLSNIKEKYENLVNDSTSLVNALKEVYSGESEITDWLDGDFSDSVGDENTGYTGEVLDRLEDSDNQRVDNCMSYGPVESVLSTVKESFKDVQLAFVDIIDYMYNGEAFNQIYSDLYDYWLLGDSTAMIWFINNAGGDFVTSLNNITSSLETKINEARTATSDLAYRFLTWVGTTKLVQTFETFVEELGCVGESTPGSMWDYRSSTLKERIDMVHQARTLTQEELDAYLTSKGDTLASTKQSELETILDDIKP